MSISTCARLVRSYRGKKAAINMESWIAAFGLSLYLLAQPVAAGQIEDATAAYDHGDYETAFTLWKPLADQGFVQAQNNLGIMYEDGHGVPQDYAEAVKWYRKAADQGYAPAQSNLGTMYYKGQGVPFDFAEAVTWSRKAAEQGLAEAQLNLGVMLALWGGQQKAAEALKWLHKAADQGNAAAQSALGTSYFVGGGVPKDFVQALMWFNLAANSDRSQAYLRDMVAKHMTPDQIAEAQRLAKEWLASHPKP